MELSNQDKKAVEEFQRTRHAYESVLVCADVVVMTIYEGKLQVLLQERSSPPFQGKFSLPGVIVNPQLDGDTFDAAHRALHGKAKVLHAYLEKLETFSGSTRDPRGWSLTDAYICLVPYDALSLGSNIGTKLVPTDEIADLSLAFDHAKIVESARNRIKNKVNYSLLPAYLLPEEFTLPELQKVYELILGPLEKQPFRKRILSADFIEQAEGKERTTEEGNRPANRPAKLYRIKRGTVAPTFSRNIKI